MKIDGVGGGWTRPRRGWAGGEIVGVAIERGEGLVESLHILVDPRVADDVGTVPSTLPTGADQVRRLRRVRSGGFAAPPTAALATPLALLAGRERSPWIENGLLLDERGSRSPIRSKRPTARPGRRAAPQILARLSNEFVRQLLLIIPSRRALDVSLTAGTFPPATLGCRSPLVGWACGAVSALPLPPASPSRYDDPPPEQQRLAAHHRRSDNPSFVTGPDQPAPGVPQKLDTGSLHNIVWVNRSPRGRPPR